MSTRSFQKPVFLKELKEWPFNGRSSWNRVRYVPYLENFYNIPQKLTLKSRFQSSLLPYTGISCKENIYKLKKWPRERGWVRAGEEDFEIHLVKRRRSGVWFCQ